MFYYLEGKVAHIGPSLAVIDCGGVGFSCFTTSRTLGTLSLGKTAKLYTFLYTREDVMDLYGFASEQERTSFQMLLGVSGVGPKAAIALLSTNTPERLAVAIVSDDTKALTAAPGIGKKIAQRIILELKDKLSKGQIITHTGEAYAGGVTVIPQDKRSEATAALAVLGYAPGEIATALSGIDLASLELQDIIKQALKKMVK